MNLEIGKVYKFWKSEDDFLDLQVTDVTADYYWAKVLNKGSQNLGTPVGGKGRVNKKGKLFEDYHVTCIYDSVDDMPVDDTPIRKKRRTSDEVAVDKLIDHVQRKFQLDQLYRQIDEALENDDVGLFIRLSKEYANLKKRVTA
jgi:hypothetical protein